MSHKGKTADRFRYSDVVLMLFSIGLLIMIGSFFGGRDTQSRAPARELVSSLGLSDLALFTEARYLRHLSQADLHSAFQDHPVSFDHFPGGSLVMPRLIGITEGVDHENMD
ncbi:MAG: hypothetical protein HWE30_13070 [Methylocystaceae bacterium]|nr:hypothetical protein [Methylocystaceae bacterium]